MSDLISRQALLTKRHYDDHDVAVVDWDDIDTQPTIDAVPVVRCKECKHYEDWGKDGDCYCTRFSADPYEYLPMEDDDFCSKGERSEE